jgi:dihydroxy-acid dehydratase
MEDLYYSGGLPALIKEMSSLIHNDAITVNGKSIGENSATSEVYNRKVISTLHDPFKPDSGIVVVKGNLAPNGAVIKPSAASPELLKHSGKAVVFENIEDYHARIDDPELDIDASSIMVLKNVGPKGYPGMAEVGNMALPKKLLLAGVSDMVRISDGRMSGTGFGTVFAGATSNPKLSMIEPSFCTIEFGGIVLPTIVEMRPRGTIAGTDFSGSMLPSVSKTEPARLLKTVSAGAT